MDFLPNYFEEPVPDLSFPGWTTRLYRTFSLDISEASEKADTLTVSSLSQSSHHVTAGGSESDLLPRKDDSGSGPGAEQDAAAAWRPSRRTTLVFSSLCILQLMVSLDSTSIGTALSVSTNCHQAVPGVASLIPMLPSLQRTKIRILTAGVSMYRPSHKI